MIEITNDQILGFLEKNPIVLIKSSIFLNALSENYGSEILKGTTFYNNTIQKFVFWNGQAWSIIDLKST
jgi:hypothetical protein